MIQEFNRDIRANKRKESNKDIKQHDKFDPSGNVQWGDSIN